MSSSVKIKLKYCAMFNMVQKAMLQGTPNLFAYNENIHQFLHDYYEQKKKQNKAFSLNLWAHKLKIKSRGFLQLLVSGKRNITLDIALKFCDYFEFSQDEIEYFLTLNKLTQCKTKAKNIELKQKLKKIKTVSSLNYYTTASNKIIENPLSLRLHTLLSLEDIEATIEYISQKLKEDPLVISDMLETLKKINWVTTYEKNNCTYWKSTKKFAEIKDDPGNKTLIKFHSNSLEYAQKALNTPDSERLFKTLFFLLSDENYNNFQNDLDQFLKNSLFKYDNDNGNLKKIYQFNTNLLSCSEILTINDSTKTPRTESC